ncbi:hypothetical protein [Caballeronia sp. AZ1_KS37]|nr:hypothetical protein [Caballeronia sp. AZ1_KS37]
MAAEVNLGYLYRGHIASISTVRTPFRILRVATSSRRLFTAVNRQPFGVLSYVRQTRIKCATVYREGRSHHCSQTEASMTSISTIGFTPYGLSVLGLYREEMPQAIKQAERREANVAPLRAVNSEPI